MLHVHNSFLSFEIEGQYIFLVYYSVYIIFIFNKVYFSCFCANFFGLPSFCVEE